MKNLIIGIVMIMTHFVNGQNTDTVIYSTVDVLPYFEYKTGKNTNESLKLFANDSLRWPSQDDCIGTVYVQTVIEKNGQVSNPKILRGLDACNGFNYEAIRFVKSMPIWIPAKLNEQKVRCLFVIPVRFYLN